MNRLWLVALYEYTRNVFKKSFILALLSVPLMLTLNIGVGFVMESLENNTTPIGYVDLSGLLDDPLPAPEIARRESVEIIPFATEDAASEALQAKAIQAYYVISADYLETSEVNLFFENTPSENAAWQFSDFMQINLLQDQPLAVAQRAAAGTDVIVRTQNGQREVPPGGPTLGLLLPLLIGFAFLALLLFNSGYLMQAVVDEKENRTMEVLVTSISSLQLIGGKVLGVVAIALTQLVVWTAVMIAGIVVANQLGIAWLRDINIDWSSILGTVLIAIPAYVLASALMMAIGSVVTTSQEAQSMTALLIVPHVMIPVYISWAFIQKPNSALAIGLTLAPFTALMTTSMRHLFTIVPWWQVFASAAIQTAFAIGALWLASRAFRLGMLRYGQRLRWRELWKARSS